jgi:hypothetical protein
VVFGISKIPPTFVVNVIQIGSYREHLMAWRNRWRVIKEGTVKPNVMQAINDDLKNVEERNVWRSS